MLLEVLQELHREVGPNAPAGDSGLGDFGEHLLPRLVERGRTGALALDGYWRDLGQPHYYLRAHRELLRDDVGVLGIPGWPILTRHASRAPARVLDGAESSTAWSARGASCPAASSGACSAPAFVSRPGRG